MNEFEEKKKQNKKNRRRAILIAFLLMLIVGAVLGTGTYAWFTANKTVTVDDITVKVATSNGLQISADAITFKTILSNNDLKNAKTTYGGAVNQIPSSSNEMVPVSSVGAVDTKTGFMNMYRGEIVGNETTGENILTTEKSTEVNGVAGDFIAFDIFLQVTQASTVYLTSNSKVTASGTSSGIENAARIAFVYEGHAAAGTAAGTIQALKSSATTPTATIEGNQAVKIWELNNDVHTAAGVSNASSVYGQTTKQTGATPLAYNGVKAPITKANAIPVNSTSTTYFGPVASPLLFLTTPASGIPASAYAQVFSLQAGITKVRVYMWVEGQDVDCENNASGGALTYSLQFSTLDKQST